MMSEREVIRVARANVRANPAMESSARLALADAVKLLDAGDYDAARTRALVSLSYSVGKLSAIYLRVAPIHIDGGNGRPMCSAKEPNARLTKRGADASCRACKTASTRGPKVLTEIFRF
jgi:hypothetical protein